MKRLISILILAVMLMSMAVSITPVSSASETVWFTDVPQNKWYYDSVKYVNENSLMVGTTDTEFSPDEIFSRAMLVTVLWRLEGSPDTTYNVYDDVPTNKWYTKAVAWASINNIVAGFGDGSFKPNDPITREQMTSIFKRYAEYLSIDTSARTDLTRFADASKISKWAKSSMNWAIAVKLVYGVSDTVLNPQGNATRAQSAAILERFCKEILVEGDFDRPENPTPDDECIMGAISNTDGFIPDAQYALEDSEKRAFETSMYNFDNNRLVNPDRKANRNTFPSFDIDRTGFVRAGTKLSGLRGKKLEFFTADTFPAWSYRNAKGETIDEWTWFKDLKDELGLSIKYTMKQHDASINAVLQYMNAGKQCDVIYTNRSILPQALCISKSITPLINIHNLGSSPGVSKITMEHYRWGNTLRLVAPVGDVDVLWYNETLTKKYGMSDPHTLWEKDKWDWAAFKNYLLSSPESVMTGKKLVTLTGFTQDLADAFALTNGKAIVRNKADSNYPKIIFSGADPQVLTAFEFLAGCTQRINYKAASKNLHTASPEYLGLFEGTTLMASTMYTHVYRGTEFSKDIKLNWVPYPKANSETGRYIAHSMGRGMLLPRMTVKPENENAVLKFMELWATRFSEACFDNLQTFEYYDFDYKQRKQYFDFVINHIDVSLAGSLDFSKYGNLMEALGGNTSYNVKNEVIEYAKQMFTDLKEIMNYGN